MVKLGMQLNYLYQTYGIEFTCPDCGFTCHIDDEYGDNDVDFKSDVDLRLKNNVWIYCMRCGVKHPNIQIATVDGINIEQEERDAKKHNKMVADAIAAGRTTLTQEKKK